MAGTSTVAARRTGQAASLLPCRPPCLVRIERAAHVVTAGYPSDQAPPEIDSATALSVEISRANGPPRTLIRDVRVVPRPIPHDGPVKRLPSPADAWSSMLVLSVPPHGHPMGTASRQAEEHVRRGDELADRGALFSARAAFVSALDVLSQGLDAESAGVHYSRALAAGLLALEEAEHFVPSGGDAAGIDLAVSISAHRTPVLKGLPRADLTAETAREAYFTFAREQLGVAAGTEPAGSMALYGLGKVYTALAGHEPPVQSADSKAMVFHQAALATDPGNALAANELAVLLVRRGRYEAARELLERSVPISTR